MPYNPKTGHNYWNWESGYWEDVGGKGEMWNHTFTIPCVHATDHFVPLQDEALEAAKTVPKRVYKSPSFHCPGQLQILT